MHGRKLSWLRRCEDAVGPEDVTTTLSLAGNNAHGEGAD